VVPGGPYGPTEEIMTRLRWLVKIRCVWSSQGSVSLSPDCCDMENTTQTERLVKHAGQTWCV